MNSYRSTGSSGIGILLLGCSFLALGSAEARAETGAPETQTALAQADPGAQQSDSDSAAGKDDSDRQDIVVTARRRDEKLQDVPIAISALAGDQLASRNVTSFQDLATKMPGLNLQPSGQGSAVPGYTIRSQRQYYPYATLDPSVAVYFADVIMSRPAGVNSGLYDLASVQMLKGPQGTLFGRNTTGGAIVITPQRPTDELSGYGRLIIGNYDLRLVEGALNLPVSDSLQFRAAGQSVRRDGYSYNLFDGNRLDNEHSDDIRLSATLKPNEAFENRLVMSLLNVRQAPSAIHLIFLQPGTAPTTTYPTLLSLYNNVLKPAPFHQVDSNVTARDGVRIKNFMLSNTTEVQIGSATLRNILGYRHVKSSIAADFDGSPFAALESRLVDNTQQLTNETQLLGTAFGGNLNYILGGYYFREKGTEQLYSTQFGVVRTSGGNIQNTSYSGFAQITLKMPFYTPLSFTGGVRQNHDKREFDGSLTITPATGVCRLVNSANQPLNPCVSPHETSFNKLTYTLGLDWKANDDLLLYVTTRRGYRSGGFNLTATSPLQFTPFSPEVVTDVEAGAKFDFRLADRRGRFNIATYRSKYSNIQRNQAILIGNALIASVINAAKATVKGVEIETSWSPVQNIELSAFYVYSHAAYDEWIINGVDNSIRKFAGAPKNQIGGNVRITLPVPAKIGELAVSANVFHQSSYYMTDDNWFPATGFKPQALVAPRTLLDGRVEWNNVAGSKNVNIAFFVKNLLDEEYDTGGIDASASLGLTGTNIGPPRTYGAELSFRF